MAQNQLPFRAPPPVQKHVDPAHCTSHASKSPSAMVGGELGLLANWKLGRHDWPSSQDINIYQPWLFDTTRTSILFPWSLIFFSFSFCHRSCHCCSSKAQELDDLYLDLNDGMAREEAHEIYVSRNGREVHVHWFDLKYWHEIDSETIRRRYWSALNGNVCVYPAIHMQETYYRLNQRWSFGEHERQFYQQPAFSCATCKFIVA